MSELVAQFVNVLAAILLMLAFAMISQRRILSLIQLFTMQGFVLVCATAIVGYVTQQPHLYLSAGITLVLKVVLIPLLLHRVIDRLNVRWDVETLINIPTTMIIGIVLVIFAFDLAAPISKLSSTIARGTLGIALDVLVGVLILGVFLFHIREQFDSLDIRHLEKLKED
jgi:hydrogenase-4 component E